MRSNGSFLQEERSHRLNVLRPLFGRDTGDVCTSRIMKTSQSQQNGQLYIAQTEKGRMGQGSQIDLLASPCHLQQKDTQRSGWWQLVPSLLGGHKIHQVCLRASMNTRDISTAVALFQDLADFSILLSYAMMLRYGGGEALSRGSLYFWSQAASSVCIYASSVGMFCHTNCDIS